MSDPTIILDELFARMASEADETRVEAALRFFPSKPPILGLPSGLSNQLGKELAVTLKGEDLDTIIQVGTGLYATGVMEHAAVANEMLGRFWRRFGSEHWDMFDHWIGLFTCWGTTDSFCLKVLSHVIERHGLDWPRVQDWAHREGLWYRRASLVCLTRGLRKGEETDEFFQLADELLSDKEPMIQKAIGWMLKELSGGDAKATIGYLQTRSERMSKLAFRYAQEKLTPEQKARVASS